MLHVALLLSKVQKQKAEYFLYKKVRDDLLHVILTLLDDLISHKGRFPFKWPWYYVYDNSSKRDFDEQILYV